ncbi:MAG: nitroreductase family protein [archaeon]
MRRRTIRRFQKRRIPYDVLEKCVNAARLGASGANLQPCEYVIVDDEVLIPQIFSTLKWAGYIAPEGNPPAGEEPSAYIVILLNRKRRPEGGNHDVGIAAAHIALVALEKGVGCCMLGSVDRDRLREILKISEWCDIDLVMALGYPNEEPIQEETMGSIKYWKDKDGMLHVPKRRLADVTHHNKY